VFISTNVQPVVDVAPTPFHVRPFIAADALAFYMVQFAAPLSFGIDYGRSLHLLSTQRTLLLAGILPVTLAFASWMLRRRVPELERALELDPRRAQTHQRLGALWLAQDEPDRAAAHFRSALVLDPENTEARQGLARARVLPPTTVPPSGVQHIGPVRPLR
jgi:tetratricopeptide (TPR) repeat protein